MIECGLDEHGRSGRRGNRLLVNGQASSFKLWLILLLAAKALQRDDLVARPLGAWIIFSRNIEDTRSDFSSLSRPLAHDCLVNFVALGPENADFVSHFLP